MIVVRTPLRISFVGGGTDFPEFYRRYPGRVISATIDKHIYVVVKPTPLIARYTMKYDKTESVERPNDLEHTRVKAAFMDLGINHGIEIGSFVDLPGRTGLGSSSSFSVGLMKGLHAFMGRKLSREQAAVAASRLEIELVGEPIGKQDQYAAAYGGINMIQFNPDDTVTVEPLLLDFRARSNLEQNLMLFFTGIARNASAVLLEQRAKIEKNFETYKTMSDSALVFRDRLLAGDMQGIAAMLHEGWLRKKTLASNISNELIDELYETGTRAGAWGGKILGAGGGGCILFIVPPDRQESVRRAVAESASGNGLAEFREIPIRFTQSGADVVFHYKPMLT